MSHRITFMCGRPAGWAFSHAGDRVNLTAVLELVDVPGHGWQAFVLVRIMQLLIRDIIRLMPCRMPML